MANIDQEYLDDLTKYLNKDEDTTEPQEEVTVNIVENKNCISYTKNGSKC